ncbi:MAG: CPBP family intramembrane metalloprotease [Desulfobacterales bacterium]|nr:CPBP family intramembrane metalloprotease [Desulfobacterales bacterium]
MSLRSKLLGLALLVEGATFIAALVLARQWGISLFPLTEHLLRDILIGTAAAVIPFALFCFTLSEKAKTLPLLGSIRRMMRGEIKAIFASTTLIDICLISLWAGLAEELLFRGVIQAKWGLLAASILFGVLHFVTPAYALLAMVIGIYIGLLHHFFQSLLIPIQLHAIYDFGALIYLKYFVRK